MNGTSGLTDAQIQLSTEEIHFDLEHFTYNNFPTQCPISLDEFTPGETLLQLRNCKHVFRPAELRRWFSQHSRCPVCRTTALISADGTVGYSGNTLSRPAGHTVPIGPTGNHRNNPRENTDTTTHEDDDVDYSDMPDLIENFADNAYHFEYSYYFEFPQHK
jgi:hypothetical protein